MRSSQPLPIHSFVTDPLWYGLLELLLPLLWTIVLAFPLSMALMKRLARAFQLLLLLMKWLSGKLTLQMATPLPMVRLELEFLPLPILQNRVMLPMLMLLRTTLLMAIKYGRPTQLCHA